MPSKFKELTGDALSEKIVSLPAEIESCLPLGDSFYMVYPDQGKKWQLLVDYKPEDTEDGIYSQTHNRLVHQSEALDQAQEKLAQNQLEGSAYNNDSASLKLHLNINNIGELDETIILELIKLLITEATAANSMQFHFKIIDPRHHIHPRFANNDQITIYFDKYSSTADMLRLAETVHNFFAKNLIPENSNPLGPKDRFVFNPFVSARFDNNKLLQKYGVYPFFDLALKKFFSDNRHSDLSHVPLCAFETVFNRILLSSVQDLQVNSSNELNQETDEKIQREFAAMVQNPKAYIGAKRKRGTPTEKQINAFNILLSCIQKEYAEMGLKEADANELHWRLRQAFRMYRLNKEANFYTYTRLKDSCLKTLQDITRGLSREEQRQINRRVMGVITSIGAPFMYQNKRSKTVFFANSDDMPHQKLLEKMGSSDVFVIRANSGKGEENSSPAL
ncbi:hypothetical protein ACFORL_10825 [Legionella dresdenensis]|uniref:Uncharacterized protein n=1 Tax=Legionella dresdenensis TaxID=450200 RepID=A0ABV8CGX4_9GAMM